MTKTTIALAASLAVALTVQAADWPQYRGPNLDGSTTEKIATKWPAGGLKALWKVPAPGGFSSFTVSGGKAFTQVTRNVGGVDREVAIALDANTGKEAWAFPVGGTAYGHSGGNAGAPGNDGGDGPRSTPTVVAGKVYVLSSDLALFCLDANSGKQVWTHDLMKEFAGRNINWKNAASPVVDGNLVFVAGGGAGQSMLAFNKDTGALAWKSQDETITHSTPVVAAIHGVKQVVYLMKSGLVSVAAADGKLLWKAPYRFNVSTAITPVVAGDMVYCSAGYGVGGGAFKVSKAGADFKAEQLWQISGDKEVANHWSTPVFKDGHLYGMFQFKEYGTGALKCVELATGKVKWSKPGFGPGNVILLGGQMLALSDAGDLVVVEASPSGYTEVSRAKAVTGKCWSTPVVSNGRVYVRSTKEAACFDVSAKAAQN
ncbi:MAG: alcohol dehydrogenase [Verrucomicrobia bacterium]|nr:alcohol dehydrogenase [Verrucomicrobiota bacterium]